MYSTKYRSNFHLQARWRFPRLGRNSRPCQDLWRHRASAGLSLNQVLLLQPQRSLPLTALCLSSPLLNDYIHFVTSYPIQQVLAPHFGTRSFETLCDAGTSPGAKPNNFSRLTVHDDHKNTTADYNSSFRALHLDRHHTALPLLPSLPKVKIFNYQQHAPRPKLLSQRWLAVIAIEVGHNAVEHPIPHLLSLYSTSPPLRMACTT